MTDFYILQALQNMLYYTMMTVCIITVPMLIVGLIFSIIQSATQINEMTITFIPKLIVMFCLLFAISPWLMTQLIVITRDIFLHLPNYIR